METLQVKFRFDIGDFVYFKQALNNLENEPQPYLVVKQILERDETGIKKLYKLANYDELVTALAISHTPPCYTQMSLERKAEYSSLETLKRQCHNKEEKGNHQDESQASVNGDEAKSTLNWKSASYWSSPVYGAGCWEAVSNFSEGGLPKKWRVVKDKRRNRVQPYCIRASHDDLLKNLKKPICLTFASLEDAFRYCERQEENICSKIYLEKLLSQP